MANEITPLNLNLPGAGFVVGPAAAAVVPAAAQGVAAAAGGVAQDAANLQAQGIQAAAALDLGEVKLPEDFVKAADKNADGYLSGNEVSPALRAHFPNQARITSEDIKGLLAKQEATWMAEFKKADQNGDGWLSGTELTAALQKYDQGGNFKLPNGQTVVELTPAEFLAGRKAEFLKGLQLPPGAEPVGGGGPATTTPAETPAAPAQQAEAPAPARRKKKKRGFFNRLKSLGKIAFRATFFMPLMATRFGLGVARAGLRAGPQIFRVVGPLPMFWPRIGVAPLLRNPLVNPIVNPIVNPLVFIPGQNPR